jgi:Ca-activated chloride channel homolog
MAQSKLLALGLLGATVAAALVPRAGTAGTGPAEALRAAARRPSGAVFMPQTQTPEIPDDDRTLAPYFQVVGDDRTDRLPLKETSADVDIAGVIARVRVRQVWENHSDKPVEAVYVFPASTRAAVHAMRMKIGVRTIEARIERRAKARADYDAARFAGRRAALLEQQRENVFTMNVANLMPNDRIEVELDYSELLVPEDAVYEFVYPTVVGPRYGGGADPDRDRWIASPYLHEGQAEPYAFDIRAHLSTSIPLRDVSSPSHAIDVTYGAPASADVRLKQPGGGNRDFVLRYRLAGDRIETGLLLFEDQGQGTFALMMEPPRRPVAAQIPPREFIFLVDVSGSMSGFPLDTAKELMRGLLASLRTTDRFDVVLFAGASAVMSPSALPATAENVRDAVDFVNRQQGGGGTELMEGLKAAYGVGGARDGVSRAVVVVTDGFVGVESQAFRFVRERLDEANLFAFGIGSSVNRALMEGMARAGLGEPFVVLKPDKAAEQAARFRAYIDRPVLTDVRVRITGLDAYDVLPDKVPDLLAERPIMMLGRYRGRAQGRIEISGRSGTGEFRQAIDVRPSALSTSHAPLRWLWARQWVATLSDELTLGPAQELEDAITDLGLRYSLLTRFTSFVAADSEVANRGGSQTTVQQPQPLAEGVANLAVGGAAYANAARMVMPAPAASPGSYGRGAGAMAIEAADEVDKLLLSAAAPTRREARVVPTAVLEVVQLRAEALDGAESVRQAVEKKLRELSCPLAGRLRLRLTVDRTGKIVAADVLDGAATLGRCVTSHVLGMSTAGRPHARDRATIEISIRTR